MSSTQTIENLINGYATSEDSSFLIPNVTEDFLAVRPSGNPISAKGLVGMFDNKDLVAESSELIKIHKIEIFGEIAYAVFTLNEIFSYKGNKNKDPLGHAEIMALRQASLIKNDWRFNECIIITNLEPCTMCSSALIQARMGKVIFGAYDKKRGGLGGSIDLSKHESAHHKMEIIGGILEEECSQILQLWFKKLRTQK